MPFFITSSCVDEKDMSCVEECPVDCIYVGGSKLYINPKECIDCGACMPVCPVDAVASDATLTPDNEVWKADNARFFYEPLPGRAEPLGNPGGARKMGPLEVDTDLSIQAAGN